MGNEGIGEKAEIREADGRTKDTEQKRKEDFDSDSEVEPERLQYKVM